LDVKKPIDSIFGSRKDDKGLQGLMLWGVCETKGCENYGHVGQYLGGYCKKNVERTLKI
jgi:hypothetical protein